MINIWLLYDYFTTVLDYVYNVLSVLVLLTRTIGIGLIALLSPKVLLGSVRKGIIYLIMGGGGICTI